MPQKSYTDADLERFGERPKLGVTIERPGKKSSGRSTMDDELDAGQARVRAALEGAKKALGPAYRLGYSVEPYELTPPANPADYTPRHPVLREVTQALQRGSAVPLVGAGATAATGIGAPLSGPLVGLSTAMAAPDAIRRALIPEDDESRLFGIAETAALGAPSVNRFFKGAAAATNPTALQRVGQAINKTMVGHPNATSARVGRVMMNADKARVAEGVERAGEMAQTRMVARDMEKGGFGPTAVQKATGLHPNAPRSASTELASGSQMKPAVNPNQVIKVADDVAQSNNGGRFMSRTMRGERAAQELPNYTKKQPQLAALQNLARGGRPPQSAGQQVMSALEKEPAAAAYERPAEAAAREAAQRNPALQALYERIKTNSVGDPFDETGIEMTPELARRLVEGSFNSGRAFGR